ncbi:MAG TPA: aldehyde dehydrogenase [Armatimonadetes bacterium]|nr:aldehyde dehydrogenase [Armatimonadota bacterium]
MLELKMYINGQWVESESGKTFAARNPATGEVIAHLPEGTREDARRAVAAANENKHRIAEMPVWERARLCERIAEVMEKRREELARILTLDQGKPYHTEAQFEVRKAAEGWRNAAEHIKWLETSFIPVEDPHKRVFTIRQPRGVYAIITPWNFPLNIPIEYLAPGLAAGNAIVWVPAPTTSAVAVKMVECLEEAEVPPGVVNLVTGPGPVVGDEIVAHPGTDAVGFTGSSATGEHIARRAAGKPLLLELGGNGPTIILEDADLERAVQVTAEGCFLNAGQICCATERILVHERVHEEVVQLLVSAAQKVRLGDPFDENTTMGPLNNEPTAQKMDRHLRDAQEKGATLLYGGRRAPEYGSDLFYQPTVVDKVPRDSALFQEESFGPVAPVTAASSDEELLRLANDNPLGLVSAVFTESARRAFYFAERLQTGIVNINDSTLYWELHLPFGGASGKRSGIGRLGGKYTLLEMTDLKTICWDIGG